MFNQFVKDNEGKVKVAAQFDTGEQYGVGMKLGNDALKNVVDSCDRRGQGRRHVRRDLRQVDRRHAAGRAASGASSTAPSSN